MPNKEVTLRLGNYCPIIVEHVSQGDTDWTWVFQVVDDHGQIYAPEVRYAILAGNKPDGHAFAYLCTKDGDTYKLPPSAYDIQMTAAAGDVRAELRLLGSNGKGLGSCNFTIRVEEGPEGAVTVASDSSLPAYLTILNKIGTIPDDVAGYITEWLETHISGGQGVAVDNTLTVQGAAADAKAAGDRISALEEATIETDDTLTIEGAAADAKATGDAIAAFSPKTRSITGFGFLPVNASDSYMTAGQLYAGVASNFATPIPLKKGDVVCIEGDTAGTYEYYTRLFVDGTLQNKYGYRKTAFEIPYDCEGVFVFKRGSETALNADVVNDANAMFTVKTGSATGPLEYKKEMETGEISPNIFNASTARAGYIDSDGSIHAASQYGEKYMDFFEIELNTLYMLKVEYMETTPQDPYVTYAFYDANKTMVGTRQGGMIKEHIDQHGNKYVAFPIYTSAENVKYFRFCLRTYGAAIVSFYKGSALQMYFPSRDELFSIQAIPKVVSPVSIRFPFKSINHRGFRENGMADNTIEAFKNSKRHGFDLVETDINETSDGELILWHDSTITINGTSKAVSACTYAETQTVDIGTGDYAGTKIPTFEQLAALCRKIDLWPYIELKNATEQGIEKMVSIAKKYGILHKCTWISFNDGLLYMVASFDPMARLGFLVQQLSAGAVDRAILLRNGKNEVYIGAGQALDAGAAAAVEKELPVELWTINAQATIENSGPYVSGITSDTLHAGKVLYDANID